MEVISSENYPGSPRLEEVVHSLYADEQPKRRLKSKEAHSKLADTVGIENTIMLTVEELAKATARPTMNHSGDELTNRERSDMNNSAQDGRQTRTYIQRNTRREGSASRRYFYDSRTSPGSSDINLGDASAEPRTSVIIRGLPPNRNRKQQGSSESETELEGNAGVENDELEKQTEYGNLRCYEQFEKESGNALDGLSSRGNYIQTTKESRMETSRNLSNNAEVSTTQVSENISVNRSDAYPISAVDRRLYSTQAVFLPAHVHDMNAQFRMQHPPDFPISQHEPRGKQFFDRGGLAQAPAPGIVQHGYPVNPHGKFAVQDGMFMQTHADLPNTYGGYSRFETRSPASSTSSGKDREVLNDLEPLKNNVQHFPSPVGSARDEHAHTPPMPNSLNQQKMSDETVDDQKLDGNKNIKEKRGKSSENANQCGQCLKTFASSSALAKHKLTHSDERRYICNTCGKGFKRQDHLNGHMMTHRDKKPYECKFVHCDKSYCDMRSLKRHLENYHPNQDETPNQDGTQVTPSSSKSDNEHTSYKIISGQLKNQSLTPDVDEGSPKSVQEISHRGKLKQELSQVGRKRNSDSMCSNNSEDASRRPDSHSPHQSQIYDKPMSAANVLKQVVEHAQESKCEKQVMDGYAHSGYYQFQDGSNSWYQSYPQAMLQMFQINNVQQTMLVSKSMGPFHGQLRNNVYTDPPQMVPNYPFINQNQASRGDERTNLVKSEDDGYVGMMYRDSGAPPDPTSIAIVNAKDHPKETRYKEGNPANRPIVQWKSVQLPNGSSGMPPFSMGNNSVSMQYNPVNLGMTLPDPKVSHEQPMPLNISIPLSQAEKRCQEMMDIDHEHAKRHCPVQPPSLNSGEERLLKIGNDIMKPPSSTEIHPDEVFRNPPSTPPRKPRQKPGPIHIPCSTLSGHPMSPPIYTPPPMLSPRSIFHISSSSSLAPRCGSSTPLTPSRFFLGNRSRKNSIEGETDLQEIIIPEPKINIGPHFQAEVPSGIAPCKIAEFDKHRVSVCWIPYENETKKRSQEIEAFLDMACSVAVHGGGSNKEYALHVLCRLEGNIKQAVKHILANKSAIQKEDGLADYHYEGSDRWSSKERLKFREALTIKGKDFFQISKEVETKTVSQCVEFYYLWKATHPEAMRSRTRYAETESESETLEYFSDDGNSTLVFECDFPECNSKFISRQALNGHIRVHGGSFMKPSEPKRTKVKTTTIADGSNPNVSVSTSASRPVTKTPKPPPTAPAANGDEPLPEFACRVCGRIFHKIKSRSAHMKTHVKRSDDDHRGGSKI